MSGALEPLDAGCSLKSCQKCLAPQATFQCAASRGYHVPGPYVGRSFEEVQRPTKVRVVCHLSPTVKQKRQVAQRTNWMCCHVHVVWRHEAHSICFRGVSCSSSGSSLGDRTQDSTETSARGTRAHQVRVRVWDQKNTHRLRIVRIPACSGARVPSRQLKKQA